MQNLVSMLLTFLGILLFIYLLPALLWLLVIVIVLVVIFVAVQKAKLNRYMDQANEEYQQQKEEDYTQYTTQTKPVDDDVIDVEFSESEEEL